MLYIGIAVAVFILDFFIKRYVDKTYTRKERHPKLGNKIYIQKYYNNGAVLNFLEKKPGVLKAFQSVLFVAVSIWFYISLRRNDSGIGRSGLSLLLGGAASNLLDRYTKGHVVDYVGFSFGPKWFQRIIFNVSDFFIFLGSVLIVIGNK